MVAGREVEPNRNSWIVHDMQQAREGAEEKDDKRFGNHRTPLLRSPTFEAATAKVEQYVNANKHKWPEYPLYKDQPWEGK